MNDAAAGRRAGWLAGIALVALRALAATWRIRFVNSEVLHAQHAAGRPVILALWHGELLPLLWTHRERSISVMISEHGDGEIIARAAKTLGCRTVRGSTSRGAARALLAAAREVDAGYDVAITPDGPRGPAHSVAPGALVIAQRTGAPIVPLSAWASRAWRLKSWDSFMIPKPFAEVRVAYGTPIRIENDSARKAVEAGDLLRAGIDGATARAAEVPA